MLGGGPAGLYFALLMMRRDPSHRITVIERDAHDDTFGWGIVFSDRTLAFLRDRDEPTYAAITAASQTWDNVDVIHRGEKVSIHGNGFSGIARLTFLQILHRRCREVGVDLRFRTAVSDPTDLADGDLLLGADGANSLVRRHHADFFQPSVEVRQNRYVWLGTSRLFHGLVMIFRSNPDGLFIAHAYKFSPTMSTFIVECSPETWARAGFDRLTDPDTCRYLARVFRDDLDGEPLLSNNFVKWLNFPLVKTRRWHHGHTVLAGDAAHTAHFSIGSGTKLALEDAIALADALAPPGRPLPEALAAYEGTRKPRVDAFQAAALRSLEWLERIEPHLGLEPMPFAYKHMMRSRRIGRERLTRMDPAFAARYEAWKRARPAAGPIPAEFLDLFAKPSIAHLSTLMPDGSPQVTPVWVDYDGRHVLVNSAAGRRKDLNMTARKSVALEIADPDDANRYVAVRGTVVDITEAGADAHLDRLARRYLGRDRYPDSYRFPGEVRRIYRIAPEKVTTWDPFG
ncbi:MAG TPA: TIGR03618 family F420-dependent PPOX class oxidoreductase [Methylomirabilota bacterium]